MNKYIEWAEALFDNIQTNLDSKKQLDIAREKHHLYKEKIDNYFKKSNLSKKEAGDVKITPVKIQGAIKPEKKE